MKCDFCASENVAWCYESKSFVLTLRSRGREENLASEGNWAACQECAELIDGKRKVDLALRSVETALETLGPEIPETELFETIWALHSCFWDCFTGNKYPDAFNFS